MRFKDRKMYVEIDVFLTFLLNDSVWFYGFMVLWVKISCNLDKYK